MRRLQMILLIVAFAFTIKAQRDNCILKSPQITIHFGSGSISSSNNMVPARYERVDGYCPSDGHFTFTPYTADCFRNDWHTLKEDHTPGDVNGNMLLINSSYYSGVFFRTTVNGLKPNTPYEFSTWMMNVCRITEKCPFPLLPDITIRLQTPEGKNIAQLSTGEVVRVQSVKWTQYNFMFTTPAAATPIEIVMINHSPGGCGNDFAMDDVTFRECVPPPPPPIAKKASPKATPVKKPVAKAPVVKKPLAKQPVVKKPVAKQPVAKQPALKKTVAKTSPPKGSLALSASPVKKDSIVIKPPEIRRRPSLPPPPRALTTRVNALVKEIEAEEGNIRIDLYDNGEIDGDTVTIYHNNALVVRRARISQDPVTLNIRVNKFQPYHELVMVADNLGSIPPNTSLMIVTAGANRHEVFISSTKQKNAKVVVALKE
ncbi:MAG: hypothetical protein JNK79_01715 [Chitinophagaceae bacterium]|nr:hypothetical protein [Chitinophagaceae bacterium]